MPKPAVVLLATVCAASAHAEIFKCVSKTGADVYQNFPCNVDSIGSMQTKPAPKADARAPGIGMTGAQVAAIWGEPADRYEDEQSKGRFQVWEYPGNRSVRFDHKRRVIAVQR